MDIKVSKKTLHKSKIEIIRKHDSKFENINQSYNESFVDCLIINGIEGRK